MIVVLNSITDKDLARTRREKILTKTYGVSENVI